MRLSSISIAIITSRLLDKGITAQGLENYIVDHDKYVDYNDMYNDIVENYGKLIIS